MPMLLLLYSPIWDFSEYKILLDIEKTLSVGALDAGKENERSIISGCFYKDNIIYITKMCICFHMFFKGSVGFMLSNCLNGKK